MYYIKYGRPHRYSGNVFDRGLDIVAPYRKNRNLIHSYRWPDSPSKYRSILGRVVSQHRLEALQKTFLIDIAIKRMYPHHILLRRTQPIFLKLHVHVGKVVV